MSVVDLSEFLVRGRQYTVSFKQTGLNPFRAGVDTVTSELQGVANLSQVSVKLVGGVWGLGADQFDISFVYVGDGGDALGNAVQPMLDAVNTTFYSFDYIGTVSGSSGVPTDSPGSPASPVHLPDNTTLTIIVVILLLVTFLASGGAAATRRAVA